MTFKDIVTNNELVLVDFFATWCGPCKTIAPILQDIKATLADGIKIIKVDIDVHQALAAQYNVQSVPTLMLFHNGELKWTKMGAQPKHVLMQAIEPFVSKA